MKYDPNKFTKEKKFEAFEIIRAGERAAEELKSDPNNTALISAVQAGKQARDEFFMLNMPLCQ